MNLLAKTDEIYRRIVAKANHDYFADETFVNQMGGLKTYTKILWDKEMDRIRQLAPLYHELKQVLTDEKIISNKNDNPDRLPNKWCLLTLRPENDVVPLKSFITDVEKLTKKTAFINGYYCFEQTGESNEDSGKGFHAHLLLKCKDYIKGVKDILQQTNFIKYNCMIQVGSKKGKKFILDKTNFDMTLNYIKGDKHNDAKEASCFQNIIWRQNENLKDLYEF